MAPQNQDSSELTNLSEMIKRISEKIVDYNKYDFTSKQDCALKTFFDLVQEIETQQDFYLICVLIPKVFFQLECNLYLMIDKHHLELVGSSNTLIKDLQNKVYYRSDIMSKHSVNERCFSIPIKGKHEPLPNIDQYHLEEYFGIFEICPDSLPSKHMKFFFEKFVNRIGFQLHNRFTAEKNKEHLRFVKNLVNDIGHNVIVPNMYFKLFFKRLKGKINRINEISHEILDQTANTNTDETAQTTEALNLANELLFVNNSMERQFQEIVTHYGQTSMYLETLLRQSHFEEGRYVIEPRKINFREKIIRPQLDRYIPRLKERGISFDNQLSGIPDEEIIVVADEGLISQAYANLFSNAVKYTRDAHDESGLMQKFVAIGMEVIEDCFGESKNGVKFNVFSTGPHISPKDIPMLFEEGFRGNNIEKEYGTGHGLQFIREVIELHSGIDGYEPTPMGNNFYFILPI